MERMNEYAWLRSVATYKTERETMLAKLAPQVPPVHLTTRAQRALERAQRRTRRHG